MKTMKRMGAVVLALCMCFALCCTAFAEGGDDESVSYSITIENSVYGQTYKVYKIFDATYTEVTDDEGNVIDTYVSYTIDANSPWLDVIQGEGGLGDDGFGFTESGAAIFNLTPVYKDEVDELTGEQIVNYYYVTVKEGVTDEEIISFFATTAIPTDEEDEPIKSDASVQGTGGSVTVNLTEPGYYFITTTTGSVVSITTAAPAATIIDKNLSIDIKKVMIDEEGNEETAEADGMGKGVDFDVTANVPITVDDDYVLDYVIEDSMSNGLLIELTDGEFTSSTDSEGGTHYYLTDDMINEWITLYSGTYDGDNAVTETFTENVYNYSFELIGYDTYTGETTGETVHTFAGFILTYYTYDVVEYKKDLYGALEDTFGEDAMSTIWPSDAEWPTLTAEQEAIFDFDSESYFTNSRYPANASIEIKYSAHVSNLEGYENTNTITLNYETTPFTHPTPWNPQEGEEKFAKDYVYSWDLQILKISGDGTETPLEGATFTLESSNMKNVKVGHSWLYVSLNSFDDNGIYHTNTYVTNENGGDEEVTYNLVDFESTYYVKDDKGNFVLGTAYKEDGEAVDEANTYVRILTSSVEVEAAKTDPDSDGLYCVHGTTDENGRLYFEGLGTGTFILTEIVAPNGYNLLDDPIQIVVSFDFETGTFTADLSNSKLDGGGGFFFTELENGELVLTIENNAGTELPGTGGIGTTIFYVIGAILICGAVVVLVTRRRMVH